MQQQIENVSVAISSLGYGVTQIIFSGDTYPVKDIIRGVGARWNCVDKVWNVITGQPETLEELCGIMRSHIKEIADLGFAFNWEDTDPILRDKAIEIYRELYPEKV